MESLSKAKVKQYAALSVKKYRYRQQQLVVEGVKMVREALLSNWKVEAVIFREDRVNLAIDLPEGPFFQCEEAQFRQLTQLPSPEGVLAVLGFPSAEAWKPTQLPQLPPGPGLILEDIQDPGNLGTILRIADWFGFQEIICSKGCVDILNPKTLRSSMGAIFRTRVTYVSSLTELLRDSKQQVWVADMAGIPLDKAPLSPQDYLLLGNEANGISQQIQALKTLQFFHIPGAGGAESLNVAIAAAIGSWQLFQQKKG